MKFTYGWQARIILNPDILVGKPIIKGTRLAVESSSISWLTAGVLTEILRNYPGMTLEDIQGCSVMPVLPSSLKKFMPLQASPYAFLPTKTFPWMPEKRCVS